MSSLLHLCSIGDKIESRDEADFFRARVASLLQRRNLNFPGAQPVSFARRHLQEL